MCWCSRRRGWLTHAVVRAWGRHKTPTSGLEGQRRKSRDGVSVCVCAVVEVVAGCEEEEGKEGWRL